MKHFVITAFGILLTLCFMGASPAIASEWETLSEETKSAPAAETVPETSQTAPPRQKQK